MIHKTCNIKSFVKDVYGSFLHGENIRIHNNCLIDISGGVIIEDNVDISQDVKIYTHNHHMEKHNWRENKPELNMLTIRPNVFIGIRSIILSKVGYIGMNSVIGAGSVLTKSVPPNEIWAGNPARKIGDVL